VDAVAGQPGKNCLGPHAIPAQRQRGSGRLCRFDGEDGHDVERDHILRIFRETGGVIGASANSPGYSPDDLERHDEKAGRLSR